MIKLFFAVCFNLLIILPAFCRVTPISGYESLPKPQETKATEPEVKEVEFDEFKHFIQERFSTAPKADSSSINKTVGYLPSLTSEQMAKESKNVINTVPTIRSKLVRYFAKTIFSLDSGKVIA